MFRVHGVTILTPPTKSRVRASEASCEVVHEKEEQGWTDRRALQNITAHCKRGESYQSSRLLLMRAKELPFWYEECNIANIVLV